MKKTTDDLMTALSHTTDIQNYFDENEESFIQSPLSDYLTQLLSEKQKTKTQVLRACECNEIYGFQIFSGKRKPSRDKLISLAFGFPLSLHETNQLLKYAGFAPLYAKSKRDSIMIFSLQQQYTFIQANELLYDAGEETL